MTKIAIIYHSGFGHTELVAEAVRDGAASVEGVETDYVTASEAKDDLDRFDDADAIILGAPTYMGSASAPMKEFMEATTTVFASRKWQDKLAGGFTNSGSMSGDKVSTLQQFVVLAGQLGMIWVTQGELNQTQGEDWTNGDPCGINRLGGYIGAMAQSINAAPGPDNPPQGDIKTARMYGERVAKAAKRWGSGRL